MTGIFMRLALGLSVLTLVSVAVFASSPKSWTLSNDGRTVFTSRSTVQPAAPADDDSDASLVKIYDNLASAYPKGLYMCCEGATVSGPLSPGNTEWWAAVGFTPQSNLSVTKIKLAIGYLSGTNELVVTLANDASGVPGTKIHSWTITNVPPAGTCCALVTIKHHGIPVTAGTQYWITMTTNGKDQDAFFSWNVNDTDQIDPAVGAALCDGGFCPGNGQWVAAPETPGLAFAVLGQ